MASSNGTLGFVFHNSGDNKDKIIIVADDEEFNLNCMVKRLEKKGIKCNKCINGEECLELIKKINSVTNFKPENEIVIFSDIDMPKMNGLEMAEAINEFYLANNKIPNNINIIYISSDVDDSELDPKFVELKNNHKFIKYFFNKPISNKNLVNLLNEFVQ